MAKKITFCVSFAACWFRIVLLIITVWIKWFFISSSFPVSYFIRLLSPPPCASITRKLYSQFWRNVSWWPTPTRRAVNLTIIVVSTCSNVLLPFIYSWLQLPNSEQPNDYICTVKRHLVYTCFIHCALIMGTVEVGASLHEGLPTLTVHCDNLAIPGIRSNCDGIRVVPAPLWRRWI